MMSETHKSAQVVRRAHGKVNIGLHVLRRRDDGYHDISSVMAPIEWHDRLTYLDDGSFRFTCSDPDLPVDETNLCVRAVQLVSAAADIEPSGHLHLEKHLPMSAGLGGGSSDAAATLMMLAEAWDARLSPAQLADLALELGSDVPFFLRREPQLAAGRGEHLSPLRIHPRLASSQLVVIMPKVHISTAAAYSRIRPVSVGRGDLRAAASSGSWDQLRREARNDFERVLMDREPQVSRAKAILIDSGADYASVTGSGAAVFGLFQRSEEARVAVTIATSDGLRVHTSRFDAVWY